jgi:hypothetical protein
MQTIELNLSDEINIGDFFAQLKSMYPSLQMIISKPIVNHPKGFEGTADLMPIHIEGFKMPERDDLHER